MKTSTRWEPPWKLILICSPIGLAYLAYVSTAYYFLSPILRDWGGLDQARSITTALFYCWIGLYIAMGLFGKRIQSLPQWVWVIMSCWGLMLLLAIMPAYAILNWAVRFPH